MEKRIIAFHWLWFFLLLLPVLPACEGVTRSIKDTFNKKEDARVEEANAEGEVADTTIKQKHLNDLRGGGKFGNFLEDTLALAQAQEALKSLPQFAGKKINIYDDVHFYDDGRITISVQHPDSAAYVDEYHYREGEWLESKPVQLSVRTNIESKLFDLDAIQFATVSKILHIYNEKAASVEGAKAATVIYGVVRDKRFIWYPRSINGSRMRYGIEFNLDGSMKSYRRE